MQMNTFAHVLDPGRNQTSWKSGRKGEDRAYRQFGVTDKHATDPGPPGVGNLLHIYKYILVILQL